MELRARVRAATPSTRRARRAAYPTAEVLERDLLLAVPAATGAATERVAPTVAGLLLFGRDERVAELLPRSTIIASRYAGDTRSRRRSSRVELAGNLHTLFESAVRFVERYCDLWDKRPRVHARVTRSWRRPSRRAPTTTAGRCMKRWRTRSCTATSRCASVTTRLNVFDKSIEITNPRRTAGFAPAMQRAIRYGIPQRLNPQTAAVFASPAYGLALPTGGLPMLLRESRLFSGRKSEVHAVNDEFRVRLYGS